LLALVTAIVIEKQINLTVDEAKKLFGFTPLIPSFKRLKKSPRWRFRCHPRIIVRILAPLLRRLSDAKPEVEF